MKKQGYILLLTLMLTSLSVLVISTVLYKTRVLARYTVAYFQREKAKSLARSGIEIALSQLSNMKPEEKKENGNDQKKEGEKTDPKKEMLANLLSVLNRWQKITAEEDVFGVEGGEINIYISCEQGKINLSQLYDFKKDEFITQPIDGKKLAELLLNSLGQLVRAEKLPEAFQKFMKARTYPLQDVSELLLMKEMHSFKEQLLVRPDEVKEDKKEEKDKQLFLMDLFTLETDSVKIDPLMLSISVSRLLGLDRQDTQDGKKWVKDLPSGSFNWETDWDKVLAPLYKKEYKTLPQEVKPLFATQSNPTVFSVIVEASVGKIKQKMYAIVHNANNQFKLRKLYWL